MSKLLKDGVRGEGVAKARESLELLRINCGVCGERLGVEAQLEAREWAVSGGKWILEGTPVAASLLSLSRDILRPLQFLPSIMLCQFDYTGKWSGYAGGKSLSDPSVLSAGLLAVFESTGVSCFAARDGGE